MADTVDMVNRDPNGLNDHCRAQFEDIFGEPENPRSIDCVWKNSYGCFNGGINCCYKFLTALCGLPVALLWGCGFGMVVCCHVWWVTPMLTCVKINCGCARKFYQTCIDCYFGPLCETCGLCFSNIRVKNGSI